MSAATLRGMPIECEHSPLIDDDAGQSRYAAILADNVKRMRLVAKINKKRFALMVNIGRPFLNKIEDGTANPRLAIIERLADALGSTPAFVLKPHTEDESRTDGAPSRSSAPQLNARSSSLY